MLVRGLQVEVLGGVLEQDGIDGEVGRDPRVVYIDVGCTESMRFKSTKFPLCVQHFLIRSSATAILAGFGWYIVKQKQEAARLE